jgi:hypothetical protein
MKVVTWETECGWEIESEVSIRTLVFALNYREAWTTCIAAGVDPTQSRDRRSNVVVMGGADSCRGMRLESTDELLVQERFWARVDAEDIRNYFRAVCDVDLRDEPVIVT